MSQSSEPTTVRRANLVLTSCVLAAVVCGNLVGRPVLRAESEAIPRQTSDAGSVRDDKPPEESKDVATIGFLLLAVITFTGVTLVAFVMIWGHRVRRVVRGPLPTQSARDELWYLRPPKDEVDDAGPADEAAADETETL